MKLLYVSAILLLAASTQGKTVVGHHRQMPFIRTGSDLLELLAQLKVNMNDYVDKLLVHAKEYMIEHGLDPAQLPDVEKSFSAEDLVGITWHGELKLTKGWAQDLTTIYRSGDVLLEYANKTMIITANLGFEDLSFNYDFSAKIMNIGPTGNLDGKANQVQVILMATVDLNSKTIVLNSFDISRVGDINVEVSGMGTVIDWIADAIIKAAVALFKEQVLDQVEGVVRTAIEDALANINIGDFLPF